MKKSKVAVQKDVVEVRLSKEDRDLVDKIMVYSFLSMILLSSILGTVMFMATKIH